MSSLSFISRRSSLMRSALLGVGLAALVSACGSSHDAAVRSQPDESSVRKPPPLAATPPASQPGSAVIPAGKLPAKDDNDNLQLPGGGVVHLSVVAGERFLPIEGTFDDDSYRQIVAGSASEGLDSSERTRVLASELSQAVKSIGQNVRMLHVETNAEVGYFKALVPLDSYAAIASTPGMLRKVLVNPLVSTPFDARVTRKVSDDASAGLNAFDNPLTGTDAFSGLTRIGVPAFLSQIKSELGVTPDGSQVKVGVTDTGVTLNHPTFAGADGKSRVVYLKDFTGEARIFFHPDARFDISLPTEIPPGTDASEVLQLSAEFLVAPEGVDTAPVADKLSTVEDLPILVGPELRAILTKAGSGARLGVLPEAAYDSADEPIDLNHNGKTDDNLWVILIPGTQVEASPDARKPGDDTGKGKPDTLYVDLTTRGDFRNSVALTSFNLTRATQTSFQEKFGVDIKREEILDSAGEPVEVITAAVVGFDPGNHGSHVSGIIAGRKTITNDADDTLARGVAPNTTLMVDRVCANSGGCAATQGLIDLAQNGAEVVNMSIGGLGPYNDGYGVQETIINRLTAQYNTLFFISAGNEGSGRNTVGSPSVARYAISVGATASRSLIERQYQWPSSGKLCEWDGQDDDFVIFFSSRGPTAAGGFKPDLTAPGTELSSVQLNAAPGTREGLDVYWGTSMASPTAAGAATLLIDAVKTYNKQNPASPLSLDALTLRRVITASARPFDVHTYNAQTGEKHAGQYTWIDQGYGMIDLPRAWAALKAERDAKLPAAVTRDVDGKKVPVSLEYEVRVLRKNPNGLAYDGTSLVQSSADGQEARLGHGIWLDYNQKDKVIPVQIARRVPPNLSAAPDIGDLTRLLNTTADEFKLETIVHGSEVAWLKAGTLNQLGGESPVAANVRVIGAGAIDQPIDEETQAGGSLSPRDSTIYVTVNRALLNTLPPGDHGALINAYRTVAGKIEATPSFVVPVYVTIPDKTLAGKVGYSISGSVASFGVARHYVDVPKGTKLVKVTLEVPEAKQDGTDVSGCAGVDLMAYEGRNVALPPEFVLAADSRAINCNSNGVPNPAKLRRVSYARQKPNAGVWDLHVFGLYTFTNSPYTLDVEYAQLTATPDHIEGNTSALSGAIDVSIEETSFPIAFAADQSSYEIYAQVQEAKATVAQDQTLQVPNVDGVIARTYDADVAQVGIETGGSTGNDIDLSVRECDDAALTTCVDAASSAGATDVESLTFVPTVGKFYVVEVAGFEITDAGEFTISEQLQAAEPDLGTLSLSTTGALSTHFEFAFDAASSVLLTSPRFTSGKYAVWGDINLADATGTKIVTVPVKITSK